jgi:membrane protease YdiL (CAAX protease family)
MAGETDTRAHFIARYSVALFFILAMALGAGVITLVVQGVLPSSFALVSVLSASIAGIIMTAIQDGRAGLKLMLSRLLIWRVGIGYWLFALLFLVPAVLLGSLANPFFNGDQLSFKDMQPAYQILLMSVVFFIVSGVGQELGWTGFMMPRLQARYSALTSCIIRAILTGIWHLPVFLYARFEQPSLADFPYGGWIAQVGFLPAFVTMILLFQLPWAIFFTWLFNNTRGSLLLVAILHGSEVWTAFWMLSAGIDSNNIDNYWGYGAVLAVVAATIVLATGAQNLSRKHKRIIHQI